MVSRQQHCSMTELWREIDEIGARYAHLGVIGSWAATEVAAFLYWTDEWAG